MTSRRQPGQYRQNQATPGFVAVGFVRSVRGVRGELRVEPLTDIAGRFEPGSVLYAGGTSRTVERTRGDRNGLLLQLRGVATRDEAELLRGTLLEVPESDSPLLSENSYYQHEIVGLRVVDDAGNELGRIEEVLETGANDVYVARNDSGETLIPAVDSVIKQIDVANGVMVIDLLEGLQRPARTGPTRPTRSQAVKRVDR